MAKKTAKTKLGDLAEFREVAAGQEVLIGGEWREVLAVEPYEKDAYVVVVTEGRRWVRGLWDAVTVRPAQ